LTNVYGYMLQEVSRVTKAPNYVKLITFGCSSQFHWGNILSKRVEPATMSGRVRWGKHATGTPKEGTPYLMNSKRSWRKHCNTLTLSSYRNWIGETAEFFLRRPTDEKHKTNLPGCKRHRPAPCNIYASGYAATGVVHSDSRPGHFFLDGGTNIPQDSTKTLWVEDDIWDRKRWSANGLC